MSSPHPASRMPENGTNTTMADYGNKQSLDTLLRELADHCGIYRDYYDVFGKRHETATESRAAVLRALGFAVDSSEQVRRAIRDLREKPWQTVLDPVQVVSVNSPPLSIPVHLSLPEGGERELSLTLTIEDEAGARDVRTISGEALPVLDQQWIDGRRCLSTALTDDKRRDMGYYTVLLDCSHPRPVLAGGRARITAQSRLIVCPDACYLPPAPEQGTAWGLALNLYAVRSSRNWGVGDLTDLAHIAAWAGGLGAAFVGVNPLHAIPNEEPYGISPYSPLSRLFRNFLYLDVEQVPDVRESEAARQLLARPSVGSALDRLRQAEQIDYSAAAALKQQVLALAFDHFHARHYSQDTERGRAFKRYFSEAGQALRCFSLFCAIDRFMRETKKVYSWRQWPAEYHDPCGAGARAFGDRNEQQVLFSAYLQWLIDEQLGNAACKAAEAGMAIGLYQDLAVGAVGNGSDAWIFQHVVAHDISVGAPPDDFNPLGQNWGFPPFDPLKLKEAGYDPFIQTIRSNMRHTGALRIDHALGLFRLFWIPRGMSADKGAYIALPSEDLLRIIALESHRSRTVVIGEDLGTISDEVRAALKRFRILSTRLLYFERNYPDPSFLAPERYPDMALCAVTTHDLATLSGYWACRDIDAKERLGILCDGRVCGLVRSERDRDRKLLVAALKAQGLLPADDPEEAEMSPAVVLAVYGYLAKTPCKLVQVSLDDMLGTLDQQNMPGTVEEYPNWRQKLPVPLGAIMADQRFIDLAAMFRSIRPWGAPRP